METQPTPQKGTEPPIFGPCLLWPNVWMVQYATCHEGGPQPRRLCVRWGPSTPPHEGGGAPSPILGPFLLWPLGMEVGLSPGDFVLDGDPAPYPQKGGRAPNIWPMFIVAKRLGGSRWHLAWR